MQYRIQQAVLSAFTFITVGWGSLCKADLILTFLREGETEYSNRMEVAVGEEVEFTLFLRELSGEIRLSSSDFGLNSMETHGVFDSAALTIRTEDVVADPAFNDFPEGKVEGGNTIVIAGGSRPSIRSSDIALGSVRFTAKTQGITQIRFGDRDAGLTSDMFVPDFTLGNTGVFTDIDPDLFQDPNNSTPNRDRFYTLTIESVPEPGTFGFLIGACFITTHRRARRRT